MLIANLSSSGTSHIHSPAKILLVVWSANGDSIVLLLLSRQVPSEFTLLMELSSCNYVILRKNRARCALNMKILNLLNEESVYGDSSGRATL